MIPATKWQNQIENEIRHYRIRQDNHKSRNGTQHNAAKYLYLCSTIILWVCLTFVCVNLC